MFRKMSIVMMVTMLTMIATIGLASIEQRLSDAGHSWGYVQQTRVVQG